MFLTTHAATGLLASQHLSSPMIAFIVGLGIHFIMDIIPHGDEEFAERGRDVHKRDQGVMYWALIDIGFVFILAFMIAKNYIPGDPSVLALGVLGAILPDFFTNLHDQMEKLISRKRQNLATRIRDWILFRPFLKRHLKIHDWFHNITKKKVTLKYGLATQALILLICIVLELVFFI